MSSIGGVHKKITGKIVSIASENPPKKYNDLIWVLALSFYLG